MPVHELSYEELDALKAIGRGKPAASATAVVRLASLGLVSVGKTVQLTSEGCKWLDLYLAQPANIRIA